MEEWENEGGSIESPPKIQMFLIYCKGNGKYNYVKTVGPLKETRMEAEAEVIRLKNLGWDAYWVGLSERSVWIV